MAGKLEVRSGRRAVAGVADCMHFLTDTPLVQLADTALGRAAQERKGCLQQEEHWRVHKNMTSAREVQQLCDCVSAAERREHTDYMDTRKEL